METALSLLIVPLSFYLIQEKNVKSGKRPFILTFICATTLLSIICFYYYAINNLFLSEFFKVNSFRNLVIEIPLIGDHPIYISMYLGLAMLFVFKEIRITGYKNKWLLVLSAAVNCGHLLLLSSKGVIIALLVAGIFYGILTIKNKGLKFILPVMVVGFFILTIKYFPNMERRFREFRIETTYSELQMTNSSSIRIAIYDCVLKMIKANPIIGYGWGQGDLALRECYKEKSRELVVKGYNSHNQYAGYYLDGGILAFSVLIAFFILEFLGGFRQNSFLFISVLLYFFIIMQIENILNRQSGIIMFIFITMLFTQIKSKKKRIQEGI